MYLCVLYIYLMPVEDRETVWSPGPEVTDVFKLPCKFCELNMWMIGVLNYLPIFQAPNAILATSKIKVPHLSYKDLYYLSWL